MAGRGDAGFVTARRTKLGVRLQASGFSCEKSAGEMPRLAWWFVQLVGGFIVSELVANFYTKVGKFVDGCIDP